jgi:hypothetical protein
MLPQAVPDAQLGAEDKSLKWDYANVNDLLADGRMAEALSISLGTLTVNQKERLLRHVLGGATIGNEEPMILDLLRARPADAVQLIRRVGWRWLWEDLGGDNCRAFVRETAP